MPLIVEEEPLSDELRQLANWSDTAGVSVWRDDIRAGRRAAVRLAARLEARRQVVSDDIQGVIGGV